jgi:hypothetical protein
MGMLFSRFSLRDAEFKDRIYSLAPVPVFQ